MANKYGIIKSNTERMGYSGNLVAENCSENEKKQNPDTLGYLGF